MNETPKRKMVAIPDDLYEQLRELGNKDDRSIRSQVIRAIKAYLKEQGA